MAQLAFTPPSEISIEEARAYANVICAAHDGLAFAKLFLKQWNACGPNSDFGRYFSNVRDAAEKYVAKAEGRS